MIGRSLLVCAFLLTIECQALPTNSKRSAEALPDLPGGFPGLFGTGHGPTLQPTVNVCTVPRTQAEWSQRDIGNFLVQQAITLQPYATGIQQAIIDINPNISDLAYTCGL